MLFHRCFGIRISSPFHLDTLNIPLQNIKCPESPKNANIIMLPSVSLLRFPGISLLRGRYKTTQQSEKVTQGTANWSTLQSLALEQNKSLAIELQGLIKLDET